MPPCATTPHSVVCALDPEQLRCGCEVSGVTFELTEQKEVPGGVCRYMVCVNVVYMIMDRYLMVLWVYMLNFAYCSVLTGNSCCVPFVLCSLNCFHGNLIVCSNYGKLYLFNWLGVCDQVGGALPVSDLKMANDLLPHSTGVSRLMHSQ